MKIRSLVLASLLTASVSLSAQDLSIHQGWQLLGATIDITDMTVFDDKCVDFIWKYDTMQPTPQWQLHVGNKTAYQVPANIAPIPQINQGEGFWVKGNGDCTISTTTTGGGNGGTNQSPVLNLSQDYIDVAVDSNQSVSFTVSDPEGDSFTTTLGSDTPDFVTLSGETIVISPTQNNANYDGYVKIIATDSNGNSTDRSLHIHVYTPNVQIEMDQPVTSGTYDSLSPSSTPLDLTKAYYEARFSSHDGLELQSYTFANNQVTVKRYNSSSDSWEDTNDNMPYSTSDDKVFDIGNGQFGIKYIGTITGADANDLLGKSIFSGGDIGYKFAYKSLKDSYEFDENNYQTKHDNGAETQYTSISEFIDHTKVDENGQGGWWHCAGDDCHNGGITFSADSNYSNGSGTLVEVNQTGVTNNNAGSWEIKTIDSAEVLVTDITNAKDGSPIFKMDSTGLLRGWHEKAGQESIFYWLNDSAKDHFKTYIDNNYNISAN